MKKKLMLALSIYFLSLNAIANEEHDAFIACEQYAKAVKIAFPNEAVLSCSIVNRSADEWSCMYKKQIKEHWSYFDSVSHCFKETPGITSLKEHNKNLDISKLKASEACKIAINIFKKNPPDSSLDTSINVCDYSERNATQWVCMATFASHKNSYNYSAAQCFPRK